MGSAIISIIPEGLVSCVNDRDASGGRFYAARIGIGKKISLMYACMYTRIKGLRSLCFRPEMVWREFTPTQWSQHV
jgi:hypothetical protein